MIRDSRLHRQVSAALTDPQITPRSPHATSRPRPCHCITRNIFFLVIHNIHYITLDKSATMAPQPELTATYTSPTTNHTFNSTLQSLSAEPSTKEKTSYITDLRAKTSQLQNDINAYLTERMEEDKAQEVADGAAKKSARDEQREEDMYGEEQGEED